MTTSEDIVAGLLEEDPDGTIDTATYKVRPNSENSVPWAELSEKIRQALEPDTQNWALEQPGEGEYHIKALACQRLQVDNDNKLFELLTASDWTIVRVSFTQWDWLLSNRKRSEDISEALLALNHPFGWESCMYIVRPSADSAVSPKDLYKLLCDHFGFNPYQNVQAHMSYAVPDELMMNLQDAKPVGELTTWEWTTAPRLELTDEILDVIELGSTRQGDYLLGFAGDPKMVIQTEDTLLGLLENASWTVVHASYSYWDWLMTQRNEPNLRPAEYKTPEPNYESSDPNS